ncbi:hypothetical protein [Accumulibacter sp.]|nr:hypothetical protein [Accumulibacter sp.]
MARSWRHLDFFQYEAHLHAEVPRVAPPCVRVVAASIESETWGR